MAHAEQNKDRMFAWALIINVQQQHQDDSVFLYERNEDGEN